MNEFEIIKNYFAPLSIKEAGAFSLSDDAALLQIPEGSQLVVTKDAIIKGIHFIGNETPATIAAKLLRVNLSDLAAMGAKPYAYFLALMLPAEIDDAWLKDFAGGLASEQEIFNITLMGGDTTHTTGPLTMALTAIGFVAQGHALRRSGANIGDNIYVTGTIGDAALGLQVAGSGFRAENEVDEYLVNRYRFPLPRLEIGRQLHGIATSCMDISDGLMQDMGHIAECSGIGALIHWERVPLSEAAREKLLIVPGQQETILAGGDDYELLFTAPPQAHEALQELACKTSVNITNIGSVKEGRGIKIIDKNGNDIYLSRNGYNHFTGPE